MQPGEGLAHLRNIVNRDHHLALDRSGQLGHAGVLIDAEVHAITFGTPIGRVAVEQGVRPVILGDARRPVQMLDEGLGQAQMRLAQILFQT